MAVKESMLPAGHDGLPDRLIENSKLNIHNYFSCPSRLRGSILFLNRKDAKNTKKDFLLNMPQLLIDGIRV